MKYFILTILAIFGYFFTFNPQNVLAQSYYYDSYYPNNHYDSYYDYYFYSPRYRNSYPEYNYSGGCMFSGGLAAAIACGSNYTYNSNYSGPIYYQPANTNYGYGYTAQYNWPQGHPIHQTGGIAGSLAAGF